MTSTEQRPTSTVERRICTRCGVELGCCAFCEREECAEMICYRCLRIQVKQSRVRLTEGWQGDDDSRMRS